MWNNKRRVVIIIAMVCSLLGGCASVPFATMPSTAKESPAAADVDGAPDNDKDTIKKKKSGQNDNDDMGRVD